MLKAIHHFAGECVCFGSVVELKSSAAAVTFFIINCVNTFGIQLVAPIHSQVDREEEE